MGELAEEPIAFLRCSECDFEQPYEEAEQEGLDWLDDPCPQCGNVTLDVVAVSLQQRIDELTAEMQNLREIAAMLIERHPALRAPIERTVVQAERQMQQALSLAR